MLSESDRDPGPGHVWCLSLREDYTDARLYVVLPMCDLYLGRYMGFHVRDCMWDWNNQEKYFPLVTLIGGVTPVAGSIFDRLVKLFWRTKFQSWTNSDLVRNVGLIQVISWKSIFLFQRTDLSLNSETKAPIFFQSSNLQNEPWKWTHKHFVEFKPCWKWGIQMNPLHCRM